MVYRLIWHAPVDDVEYDVEADTEEDAMQTLMAYLNGEDEPGVKKV
jgi:hypothetical protein